MNRTTSQRTPLRLTLAQVAVGVMGVIYVLTGLALLFAPQWFFQNIGNFPPYNRHYEGDVGSFLLAMGVGLLIAARDPARQRLLIAVVALGSLIHVFNHLYDDVQSGATLLHQVTDLAPLVLFVLLLALGLGKPRRA